MLRFASEAPPATTSGGITVHGVVQRGDQRGRTIGFPTANLPLQDFSSPDGVWAGWLSSPSLGRWAAAVSVGTRSTFYGRRGIRLLEAHVLDFTGDLYGLSVTVMLEKRLRGQRKFPGLDELVDQLERDVNATRVWCSDATGFEQRPGHLEVVQNFCPSSRRAF
jgi:FAD synthase